MSTETEQMLRSNKKIWAIGGGKGGVGKSLVSANVSICLALMGHKVVTVDLDLGGANLSRRYLTIRLRCCLSR
jgi:flagellar biosynthesis protein FlhG